MTPAAQVTASLTTIQTSLGMTDGAEWTVLKDKIQKVLEDQQKLAAGAQNPLGGRGGGGGRRGGAAATVDATNPVAVSRDDLSKAVIAAAGAPAPTTSEADIKTKLAAVRDAVKKGTDTLVADQTALKGVCSVRQEAILVTLGVLN